MKANESQMERRGNQESVNIRAWWSIKGYAESWCENAWGFMKELWKMMITDAPLDWWERMKVDVRAYGVDDHQESKWERMRVYESVSELMRERKTWWKLIGAHESWCVSELMLWGRMTIDMRERMNVGERTTQRMREHESQKEHKLIDKRNWRFYSNAILSKLLS